MYDLPLLLYDPIPLLSLSPDVDCIELSGDESSPPISLLRSNDSVLKQQLANCDSPNNSRVTQTYLQQQLATGPRNPTNTPLESSSLGSPSMAAQTRVRMNLLRRAAMQDQSASNNNNNHTNSEGVQSKVPAEPKSQGITWLLIIYPTYSLINFLQYLIPGKSNSVPSTFNPTSPSHMPGRVQSPPLNNELSSPPPAAQTSLLNTSGGSSLFNASLSSPSMKHAESGGSMPGTPTHSPRQQIRRRIRRKACSSTDDPAEQLTEMSVRGLNLFRYAVISQGVYQCTECAKENVQKTFKNKYSFQRHAFLYHEGTQRKVFPCPMCGKEFSRPDKMKNHLKTTHECYMGKDMQFNPLNFLIGSGGPELISNNNNDSQKIDDDESEGEGEGEAGNNCSAEHNMMTALGLNFTAAQQQDASQKRLAGGPTADVMAALGLTFSGGHSGVDSLKPEVVVEGAE